MTTTVDRNILENSIRNLEAARKTLADFLESRDEPIPSTDPLVRVLITISSVQGRLEALSGTSG